MDVKERDFGAKSCHFDWLGVTLNRKHELLHLIHSDNTEGPSVHQLA